MPCSRRPLTLLVILTCLVAPLYVNTLNAPWHYDDQPNILANERLHLKTLNASAVWRTFFAQPGRDRFFRPLPNLSFALNWYAGGEDTTGYHVVNIVIHILTSFFLYLAVRQLFSTPALLRRFAGEDVLFISLLSAVLWAINPIQTQAVTYIVQRMAQMAALFYVAGLFFYLKARLSPAWSVKRGYGALAALMFLCAVLSKENAVMFLAALFLLERIFFRGSSDPGLPYGNLLWAGILLCAGIIGAFLFMPFKPMALLHVYSARTFSFWERVLTEPRIVLFYLSQIFYPVPSRLSVAHDVQLSKSLFDSPITFLAILLTAGLILLAIRWRRRRPLASFAILFYFVNHVVESTIIPLELIFEHRNYLPTLFLFVPVAAGVRQIMNRGRAGRHFFYPAMVICLVAVVVTLGMLTRERNRVWLSPETLWYDAMRKAPNQAGPVNNIAVYIGWGKDTSPEKKELAIRLFTRAAAMNHPSALFRARIYDNIGTLSAELGKPEQAESAYRTAIDLDPKFMKARHNLARLLAATAQWEKALAAADELIAASRGKARPEYYETRGFVLLWMNRPEEALDSLSQSLDRGLYRSSQTLQYTGCALSRLGRHGQAERFYKLAQGRQPLQALICFLLIENSVRAGDQPAAGQFARVLFSERNVYDILKTLKRLPEPGRTVPLDKNLVAPVIKTVYHAIGREAEEKSIWPR